MGHGAIHANGSYERLRRRLDADVVGAPDSPLLRRILELLLTPEEAALACKVPGLPTPSDRIAAAVGLPEPELRARLLDLSSRGLMIDLVHEERHWFCLPPVVIGLFEFLFMRARDDIPQAEIARLFHDFFHENDGAFPRGAFAGATQLGRSLVREEALPEAERVEILDYESATRIVRDATDWGVSLCACRHEAAHRGTACEAPQRACLTLNGGVDPLVRAGSAERIGQAEALRILEECKAAGLAQTADNVQRKVKFICNCCGCCCGMMQAITRYDLRGAIVTSGWQAAIDAEKCRGCAKCARACPVGAIHVEETWRQGKRTRRAVVGDGLCLGCGVCRERCRDGVLSMRRRDQEVYTPETIFERVALMAIERGKLSDLVFGQPQLLDARALGRVCEALEKSPPARAALAVKPLRSLFLSAVVAGASRALGPLATRFR